LNITFVKDIIDPMFSINELRGIRRLGFSYDI